MEYIKQINKLSADLGQLLLNTATDNKQQLTQLQDVIEYLSKRNEVEVPTNILICFEGFYQAHRESINLKSILTKLRLQLWQENFGIPEIEFLLAFKSNINTAADYFRLKSDLASTINISQLPWLIASEDINLIGKNPLLNVVPPTEEGSFGVLVKTHNPRGGWTMAAVDKYSQKFINYAKSFQKGKFLEIGAAFGTASLNILVNENQLFCNDMEPKISLFYINWQ